MPSFWMLIFLNTFSLHQTEMYCSLPLRLISRTWGWIADCHVPTLMRPMVYGAYSKSFGVNIEEAQNPNLKWVSFYMPLPNGQNFISQILDRYWSQGICHSSMYFFRCEENTIGNHSNDFAGLYYAYTIFIMSTHFYAKKNTYTEKVKMFSVDRNIIVCRLNWHYDRK